jgi:hypothetical protein
MVHGTLGYLYCGMATEFSLKLGMIHKTEEPQKLSFSPHSISSNGPDDFS